MVVKLIYTKNHESRKNKILNHTSQKKYKDPLNRLQHQNFFTLQKCAAFCQSPNKWQDNKTSGLIRDANSPTFCGRLTHFHLISCSPAY